MKNVLLALAQFVLFTLVFLAGSLFNPGHLHWFVTHPTPTSTREFSPGGLLAMTVLWLLLLLLEAATKKLRTHAAGTTIAYVLALLVGFVAKFGFATHELF